MNIVNVFHAYVIATDAENKSQFWVQLLPPYFVNIFIFPIKLMFSTIRQVLSLYTHKYMPALLFPFKFAFFGRRGEENLYQANGKKQASSSGSINSHSSEGVVRSELKMHHFLYHLPILQAV